MIKHAIVQRIILLWIMVLGLALDAFTQTETNVEALLEFARIKKIEADAKGRSHQVGQAE